MTATISPEIVQPAFGFGNLLSAPWLAIRGLLGQAITEDIVMFTRKVVVSSIGRACAVATVVAVALTAVEPSMAFAGSAPKDKGISATAGTSGATDISARRRYYRGGGGGAAAAAAFAGIVGTGIAIAATQNRRSYDDSYDYYDGGPTYYGGGPGYGYGGGGYYGGGYRSGVPYFNGHPNAGW
jgi:hypothetical protein